jgi:hypothetical protein
LQASLANVKQKIAETFRFLEMRTGCHAVQEFARFVSRYCHFLFHGFANW